MNSLNKQDSHSQHNISHFSSIHRQSVDSCDSQELVQQIQRRREQILLIIAQLAKLDEINKDLVHDLNFHITEYIFWSHFIFCEHLMSPKHALTETLSEHTAAMSYLTSAVQFVPESKAALSHFIKIFTDRFSFEDAALQCS